ncbi:MAG: helix-turn-helix domain-containing protein [Acidimicrobiales bacterium]
MLGVHKATLYRGITSGTCPLPLIVVNRQYYFSRRAVERFLAGGDPLPGEPAAS